MAKKKIDEYKANRIKTASPLELVIMAYDSAIDFLEKAKAEMERKKFNRANGFVVRTQKIIRELRRVLDMDIEEISGNLYVLYRVMDKLLTQAVRKRTTDGIAPVLEMLRGLRESWASISGTVPSEVRTRLPEEAEYLSVYK